jgi:hypothetical protein
VGDCGLQAIRSSETSVHTSTRCYIPEDGIFQSPRREKFKPYKSVVVVVVVVVAAAELETEAAALGSYWSKV